MDKEIFQVGRIRRVSSGFEGQIERLIKHDRNTVWRMLVEPQALAQWLAPGSIELRIGGAVHIDFADSGTVIDSTVLKLDAPKLLEYSWSSGNDPERLLRWKLITVDEGTRLVLTLRIPVGEDAARACAGFEGHLEMLAAALEGVPIHFPVDLFLKARRAYQELQPEQE
ncbi:MAG: SRPBCC family protein [Herbaspirillum sp.]